MAWYALRMTKTRARSSNAVHLSIGAVALMLVGELVVIAMHFIGWLPLAWHRSSIPYVVWLAVLACAGGWTIARAIDRRPPPLAIVPIIAMAGLGSAVWKGYGNIVSFIEVV